MGADYHYNIFHLCLKSINLILFCCFLKQVMICPYVTYNLNLLFKTGHDLPICDLQSDRDRMISSDDLGVIILWMAGSQKLKQTVVIPGYK